MKLILCRKCQDVFKVVLHEERTCICGSCSAMHTDRLNAWYKGEYAVPIGFNNKTLLNAVINQPNTGWGEDFIAFTISKDCSTFQNKNTK